MQAINDYVVVDKIKKGPKKVGGLLLTDETDETNRYKKANIISNMELIGDVTGKNVVLVDDMVDTAGTLTKAADLMISRGAKSVRAICTHPLLSGEAYKRIVQGRWKTRRR